MLEITFTISTEDANRLFECMEIERANVTASDYAKQVFTAAIRRRFPEPPRYDESGSLLNGGCYRAEKS